MSGVSSARRWREGASNVAAHAYIGQSSTVSALQDTLDRHVRNHSAPGVVAALGHADGRLEVAAAGDVALDSIVRIQSMTKAVTAVATLRLISQGRLALGDRIEKWLPELADRQVLRTPTSDLTETTPAQGRITVEHLLTNMSGYGMALEPSPLQDAMRDNQTEADAAPVQLGADAWVAALADLPLAFEPGTGWRYHHSFGLLGVLLSRVVGRPLGDHLRDDIFAPLGMPDTGYAAKRASAPRLVAAYRRRNDNADGPTVQSTFERVDPAGKGFYLEPSHLDTAHAELVSTLADYCVFASMLARGGTHKGEQFVDSALLARMTTDQVPDAAKTPESFFEGFWGGVGWGYGVAIETSGTRAGRYGWSGGLGTDFFISPDGSFGVVLTQVEMDGPIFGIFRDVQAIADESTTQSSQ